MQIKWYGHSCFLIKTLNGKRILINPFKNNPIHLNVFPKSDLITISHFNFDNSIIGDINKTTKIVNETGIFDLEFLKLEGILTFQDKCNGLKRGTNIIYIFYIDGYKICHLGDLGHIPLQNILNRLKNIDILFIPIGGNFSLNGFEAANLCKIICPKYIIPMDYKRFKSDIFLDSSKNFITSMKCVKKFNLNILDISNLNSDTYCNVILLNTSNSKNY